MRNYYQQILKAFFHHRVVQARKDLGFSQEEMAYRLAMATRTYVDLDHGRTSCSAVTLALFLVYVCNNPVEFLEELRYAFDTVDAKVS